MASEISKYLCDDDQVKYTVIHLRKPESPNPLHEAQYSVLHLPTPDSTVPPASPFERALFCSIGKEIADNYTADFHMGQVDRDQAEILGKESITLSDAGAFATIMRYLTNGPDADVHDVRLYCVEHNRTPEVGRDHLWDSHKLFLVAGYSVIFEEPYQKPDTLLVCELTIKDEGVGLEQGQWEWFQIVGPKNDGGSETEIAKWHRKEKGMEENECSADVDPWVADAEERLEEDRQSARRQEFGGPQKVGRPGALGLQSIFQR